MGVITIPVSAASEDQMMEDVLESGADNMETTGDVYFITVAPTDFENAKKALAAKYELKSSQLGLLAKDMMKVEDEDVGRRVLAMLEELDDCEDVQQVHTNFDIPETLVKS